MELERLIPQVKRLPATPQLLPKLMQVLKDPNSSADEIVETVKLDMAVAAQVQRLSNSTYYGFPDPSKDLHQAITRIGMQETYKLVAAVLSQQLSTKPKVGTLNAKDLWERSVACAVTMEIIADEESVDPVTAYSVGLLHNIGLILFHHVLLDEYKAVDAKREEVGYHILEAENEVFGYDHVEAADALLRFWKFPDEIVEPISWQFFPLDAPEEHRTLALMMNFTHGLCADLKIKTGINNVVFEADEGVAEALKIVGEPYERVRSKAEERVQAIKKMLKVTG